MGGKDERRKEEREVGRKVGEGAVGDKTNHGMTDSKVTAVCLDPLDRCIAHEIYCVLALLAVSQTLLVALNSCLLASNSSRQSFQCSLAKSQPPEALTQMTTLNCIVSSRFHFNYFCTLFCS